MDPLVDRPVFGISVGIFRGIRGNKLLDSPESGTILVGVTGWLLLAVALFGWLAVSFCIPRDTIIGTKCIREGCGERLPCAEASPVGAKRIVVSDLGEYREIGSSSVQVLNFLFGNIVDSVGIRLKGYWNGGFICRKQQRCSVDSIVFGTISNCALMAICVAGFLPTF
jgi:hypothetical protein